MPCNNSAEPLPVEIGEPVDTRYMVFVANFSFQIVKKVRIWQFFYSMKLAAPNIHK